MSAIAYITDSKMLELHRLNSHKTINFWRLSINLNFSDFSIGDLVFFLSKDKEHMKGKEKGIVGFGRLKEIEINSIKKMWERHGILNGYRTLDEFKEAVIKVSKEKKLPKKISSFYLENVTFFQPVYLSECGMLISNNIESYTYLKPESTIINLLDMAKEGKDLWSSLLDSNEAIEEEKLLYALFASHKKLGDVPSNEKTTKKAYRCLKNYVDNTKYSFIQDSMNEAYIIDGKNISILFYHDKDVDYRLLIGQAELYKKHISELYKEEYNIVFYTNDDQQPLTTDRL